MPCRSVPIAAVTSGASEPDSAGGEIAGLQALGQRSHRGVAVFAVDEQPGLLAGLGGQRP